MSSQDSRDGADVPHRGASEGRNPEPFVQIVAILDASIYPGIAECEFMDAEGRIHTLVDKVPIFSERSVKEFKLLPHEAVARCEIVAMWHDAHGRELARVSTAHPDHIESTEGLSDFVVFATQLRS